MPSPTDPNWWPTIPVSVVPKEETYAATELNNFLYNLHSFTDDFRGDLAIFDFAGIQIQEAKKYLSTNPWNFHLASQHYMKWSKTAARDGAMTIYHFKKTMDQLRASLRLCPTINAAVNLKMLGSAGKLFARYFPRSESIRNAVGHAAEIEHDPVVIGRRHPSGGVFINSINGRNFDTTINNMALSYEISQSTVDKLSEVKSLVYSSFSEIAS
jgi:hypothetical protein